MPTKPYAVDFNVETAMANARSMDGDPDFSEPLKTLEEKPRQPDEADCAAPSEKIPEKTIENEIPAATLVALPAEETRVQRVAATPFAYPVKILVVLGLLVGASISAFASGKFHAFLAEIARRV